MPGRWPNPRAFSGELNAVLFPDDALFRVLESDEEFTRKEQSAALAELAARWCLSLNGELGEVLERELGKNTWCRITDWRKKRWNPDPKGHRAPPGPEVDLRHTTFTDFGDFLCRRLQRLFNVSGFIPVFVRGMKDSGVFIPFDFELGEEQEGIYWHEGTKIEEPWGKEWAGLVQQALDGTGKHGIRLHLQKGPDIPPLAGASLMLPVRMAALRGKDLPVYDVLRVLATGDLRGGELGDVDVKPKLDTLKRLFPNAIFFGTKRIKADGYIPLDAGMDIGETIAKIGETLLSEQWRECVIMTATDVAIESYYKEFANRQDVRNDMELFIPLDADKYVWEPRNATMPEQDIEADEAVAGIVAMRRRHEVETANGAVERNPEEGEVQIWKARGSLSEFLRAERCAIVSGESGRGKSTSLKHLVLQFQDDDPTSRFLCIFIEMKRWGEKSSLVGILNAATQNLFRDYGKQLLDANRLCLVIDAVDECPVSRREAALEEIERFLEDNPNIPFFVSTRMDTEFIKDYPVFKRVPELRIRPMDEEHQRHLLEKTGWFKKDEKGQETVGAFLGKIKKDAVPRDLIENPMMLRLLASIYLESMEEPLPKSRADVYRRITRQWYEREKKTRDDANKPYEKRGKKLEATWGDWEKTREGLGKLATDFQRGGQNADGKTFKDAEIIVGPALERLCTSGLFICWDGQDKETSTVWFRHKSFQEYFCAEYLVLHPPTAEKLRDGWFGAGTGRKRWGMVFAYAVELFELEGKDIPPGFWLVAWSVHNWLAVALTGREWNVHSPSEEYGKAYHRLVPLVQGQLREQDRPSFPTRVFDWAIQGKLTESGISRALRNGIWYDRRDAALVQVVEHTHVGRTNWMELEKGQLPILPDLSRHQVMLLAQNWLLHDPRKTCREHIPDDWNKWLSEATPQTAKELEEAGIFRREDFEEKIPRWIEKASLHDACLMLEKGWAKKGDFQGKTEKWMAVATPDMACRMIECGLAGAGDFAGRLDDWLQHPQFSFVHGFIEQHGTAEMRRKAEARVKNWIATATIRSAARLAEWYAREKINLPEAFKVKIPQWLSAAEENDQADAAILDELQGNKLKKTRSTVKIAIEQIRTGEKTQKDFGKDIPRWLENADMELANEMVEEGLVREDELKKKLSALYAIARPETAWGLLPRLGNQSAREHHHSKVLLGGWEQSIQPCDAYNFWKKGPVPGYEPSGPRESRHYPSENGFGHFLKARWLRDKSPDTLWSLVQWWEVLSWPDAVELCALWGTEEIPPGPFRTLMELFTKRGRVENGRIVLRGQVKSVDDDSASFAWNVDGWIVRGELSQSNACWYPWKGLRGILEEGQELDVAVLPDRMMIQKPLGEGWECSLRLGVVQLPKNPWDDIAVRYPRETRIHGTVVSVADDGVQIRFEESGELQGWLPKSEMQWTWVESAQAILGIGSKVDAIVLEVDKGKRNIKLSCKKVHPEEWEKLAAHYSPGVLVRAEIVQTASRRSWYSPLEWDEYGVFVRFGEDGVAGLIHESEFGVNHGDRRKVWPRPGQKIEARVIKVDSVDRHFALSVKAVQMTDKQLMETYPQCAIGLRYHPGQYVTGTIGELYKTGAEVELKDGAVGFLTRCQNGEDDGGDSCNLSVGDEIRAIVKRIDWQNERVVLELRTPKRRQ